MQWFRVCASNLLWFCYSAIMSRRWRRATRDVAGTQWRVLQRLLRENADCEFGREYGFAAIGSTEMYQQRVPIRSYEAFEPHIQRIAEGHPHILTTETVQRFALTSGSTQASKYIPYTKTLVSEFQEGIDPWVHYLFRMAPRLLFGRTYWSVTPVGERRSHTAGGVAIGFDDEQMYFSPVTRWVLNSLMIAPSQLAQLRDMETFRYVTLRLLLQERSLSWISIWNPSFLTLLLNPLAAWFSALTEDIREGTLTTPAPIEEPLRTTLLACCRRQPARAQELERLYAQWQARAFSEPGPSGRTFFEAVWPALRLISCWAHGNAAQALPHLKACFPHVSIQPKGLLATEAFISFPWQGEASALSLHSHFFEFEETAPASRLPLLPEPFPLLPEPVRLAHELQVGRIYAVIVTTGGGLYRYRLNDLIEVVGFHHQCPLIVFRGRQTKVVDLCGEKLNEEYVCTVVTEILHKCACNTTFWMMAPTWIAEGRPSYTLFMQFARHSSVATDALEAMIYEIDATLQASYHYEYARRLGQLAACRLFIIDPDSDACHTYLTVCVDLGQRLGDVKPTSLHAYQEWASHFTGRFLNGRRGL